MTYDLDTVQVVQPGRFAVIETTIDNPDVMRFELKVLGTLRPYCARALEHEIREVLPAAGVCAAAHTRLPGGWRAQ